VILPKAAFYTWQRKSYEGHPVTHDLRVTWSPEAARHGQDDQLEKAMEVAKSL
jgi:hypothetical protein